mgnify:CR=1 FL=1
MKHRTSDTASRKTWPSCPECCIGNISCVLVSDNMEREREGERSYLFDLLVESLLCWMFLPSPTFPLLDNLPTPSWFVKISSDWMGEGVRRSR